MPTVKKTFRYRIYPTKEQQVLLAKHFGSSRFVYNYFLNQRKIAYLESKQTLTYHDNAKALTILKRHPDYTWMKQTNAQTLQAALRNLDIAYNKFFSKQAKFPRFKSKRGNQSFKVPQYVKYQDKKLIIPKFKKPIKVNEDRPLTGNILFATISRKSTGKYFVSITCNAEHIPYEKTDKQIGIDLGIKTLVTCSNGKTYKNIRMFKQHQKELAYQQRQLAKKGKGTNSRNRQRIKVAKIYEKMSNTRLNHLHQISSRLVRENQTICLEDLSVIRMMKEKILSRELADSCLGELIRQIQYKCNWNERECVKINRYFPSSKTCCECGFINQKLSLSDRTWSCPNCDSVLDRDFNASKNILKEGLNILSGLGTKSDTKQKREEASSLEESVNHETKSLLVKR